MGTFYSDETQTISLKKAHPYHRHPYSVLGFTTANCNVEQLTSKVIIGSVGVLLLPICWLQWKSFQLWHSDVVLTWAFQEYFLISLISLIPHFTHSSFHSFSRTAKSSTTSEESTAPEWTGRNEKQTKNTPSSSQIFNANKAQWADIFFTHLNMKYWIFKILFSFYLLNFLFSFHW